MKVWKAFGSAHSAHLTIIGEFQEVSNAQKAKLIVEDFLVGLWEDRYHNREEFCEQWKDIDAAVLSLGPSDSDFNIGWDNPCDINLEGETVIVSGMSGINIGGIIKLMLLCDPREIKITGQTGP